ncbi:MAG: NAD-dependent epimerase/dehydratase family protein [Solirubrobacterales bacterium]|nr:NAD-dependent epimerase/dehydratase family protein [Solirubrobacterales bacterium]
MNALAVAITGSQGYVGRHVARAATEAGHDVVALDRRQPPGGAWRYYELGGRPDSRLLQGIDVVVHCAYDMSVTRAADIARVNVAGTQRLLALAASCDARFCFISSMSAYAGTRQLYGRAKLASEREVLLRQGQVVRLGLVYGGEPGGMVQALGRLARFPVIPVIGGSRRQFTVHAHDMASAVVKVIAGAAMPDDAVGLAHPAGVRFADIIRALAAEQGRQPTVVPVAWPPVYVAMRAAERLPLRLPIRADSVLGLVRPATHVPHADVWPRLGARLRPFDASALGPAGA